MQDRKEEALLIILFAIVLITMFFNWHNNTHYERQGVVTNVANDIITVKDITGNIWQVNIEQNNYNQHDVVILTMYNNRTEVIEDDIIVNIKKDKKASD